MVIQVRRDPRRSLIWPPALSRVSSEVRTGGFIPSGLENLQGQRLHSLSGQPVPVSSCRHGVKGFPYVQSEPVMFQLMSVISCSTALHQLPVCQDPRAFPAELLPSLDQLQRALPSQDEFHPLDEFHEVPVVRSCSLFRSIWMAALPLSIPAAPHNLVPSADLLSVHSITSPRS